MSNLSGLTWWNANKDTSALQGSSSIVDLESHFQVKVNAFKKALENAGCSITVSSTKRSFNRAWIFHYSWAVAYGLVAPNKVPKRNGLDIEWDHGDVAKSKKAAKEIVTAAGLAYQASLSSMHLAGKAIDWTITWSQDITIKNKADKDILIDTAPRHGGFGSTDNGNTKLHAVGATYGVHKGVFKKIDGPHWSSNGK